jgi:UDP-N-acetylmuramoylalanine--D-glutamate ligase
MGLGRFGGGVGVSRWLISQGAHVIVNDAAPADQLTDSLAALADLPKDAVTLLLGGHPEEAFTSADLLVVNPAVDRATSAPLQAALAKGVPATTEMNLFLERCRLTGATTVGVTGSVGKSTTTTLIHQALAAGLVSATGDAAPRVYLGGNIGKSLLADLPAIRRQDVVVLELSSFMLDETPAIGWSPAVAVVTNVFPNHLDRHGTMAKYSAAKQNILRFQSPADVAILNADHDLVSRWVPLARARVVKFTTRGPADRQLPLVIPGEHNQSNAAAAVAVLDTLQQPPFSVPLDLPAAKRAITDFPGLSHRLQLVHSWQPAPGGPNIRFYNDSKATSPDASITALNAFPPRTALFIVGGYDKHIDLSAFENLLATRAAAVVGIGQTGPAIIDRVRAATTDASSHALTHVAGTLEAAVAWAATQAAAAAGGPSPISAVVLSPASASWDQFPNYEVRGDRFAALSREVTAAK